MSAASSAPSLLDDPLGRRRPRRADAARNFDTLLSAARECFTDGGIDVSLEEIARRADVGIATLYRHFPTRDDLIEGVYLVEVAAVCAYADEAAALAPWESLVAWIHRFVAYLNTKRVLIDGLNRQSTTYLDCRAALYQTAAPLLHRAHDAGVARADVDIDDLMRLVFALTSGIYRDEAQRDRILTTVLRGIQPGAAERDALTSRP